MRVQTPQPGIWPLLTLPVLLSFFPTTLQSDVLYTLATQSDPMACTIGSTGELVRTLRPLAEPLNQSPHFNQISGSRAQ